MNYLLRDIDPAFWAKVKSRVCLEQTSLKVVIFALLTAWIKGRVKL